MVKKKEKEELKPKVEPGKPPIDEHGQELIGVKTEKLAEGEIEGFQPNIPYEAK